MKASWFSPVEEVAMSSSNIHKSDCMHISSIRPYDFNQASDFSGGVIIKSRRQKDARKYTQNTNPSPPEPQQQQEVATNQTIVAQSSSFWEEAEKKLNDTAQALGTALLDISQLKKTILTNSTSDMLRLVMAISKQVIHHETKTNGDVILSIITQALQAAIKADEFHIKISQKDHATVTENKPLFLASISGLKNITFEADPSITCGGCLVESTLGQVDATVETKLEKIYQELLVITENNNEEPG